MRGADRLEDSSGGSVWQTAAGVIARQGTIVYHRCRSSDEWLESPRNLDTDIDHLFDADGSFCTKRTQYGSPSSAALACCSWRCACVLGRGTARESCAVVGRRTSSSFAEQVYRLESEMLRS